MKHQSLQSLWQEPAAARGFRTGVCLHGHTLHSKECLSFLPTQLQRVPEIAPLVRRRQKRIDFSRAYWTPPLTPASALAVERDQIGTLGLSPIVSLTDHDDIEAGVSLQVACERKETPVSVEWTVPFAGSIFHLGVHNLPPDIDRACLEVMAHYTESRSERLLAAILDALSGISDLLIVLNHPFWLEEGVQETVHHIALVRLLAECGEWLHAFELNGTRRWEENRETLVLARQHDRPVISGGDRHGCEPAACLNLTKAATFSEFAREIREGKSDVLLMPQYREPMPARILQAIWDIVRPYPEYPDRAQWTDRIYYSGPGQIPQPLSIIWNGETPWLLRGLQTAVEVAATTGLRSAFRWIAPREPGWSNE